METPSSPAGAPAAPALETSLVEWKLYPLLGHPLRTVYLGNFLSGMETLTGDTDKHRAPLLGNFLSGMETTTPCLQSSFHCPLGNFLSGMETSGLYPETGGYAAPWKLP